MRLTGAAAAVAVAAISCLVPASPGAAAGGSCIVGYVRGKTCSSGAIAEGGIELDARRSGYLPAVGTAGTGPAPAAGARAPSAPQVLNAPPRHDRLAADVDVPCQPGRGACLDGHHAFLPPAKAPATPPVPAPAPPAADPAVTLEDVARFVPRSASIRSQPNGWAMVGAPVNLLTDASPQVIDGTLLGRPAQVRFAPVAFTWDHGDGTSTTVEGPGALWRDLRQPDFTSTPTSHVYDTVGDRQVTLSIGYAPSYRFDGGGWQQIPGVLPVQVGPVGIRVLQGSTVLVGGVCGAPDAGPGC
jgi:hypothetical protein